ncbi:MFS transporter [Vibrio sp. JC009]|uniref:MFS transporter n=1 Tax=Vibrio sp. JC009 TaxID=2912314 RepID=UPI0023B1B6B4|nr:MFS transporter [Vibrio sp. JC009]WED20778.1 MFS transporter [Vibrio sp. JC009]
MSNSKRAGIIALLGILFLALNLRGPFTSLAPVLGQIMQDLSLSASAAGFLTALPLLSFAVFSPVAAWLSGRLGLYPSLLLALISIAGGVVLRSWGIEVFLYLGTVLIGAGIAAGNVLLPVVVKISFPARISAMTSLYVFTMGIGSTLSSSLMVPISNMGLGSISGWQLALLFNLVFPVLALVLWLPEVVRGKQGVQRKKQTRQETKMRDLLRCPIAWQVTLGIGLNSFTFYSFAGWLPKMLSDLHFSEIDAGYIYGFLQFSTMVPGLLLLPVLSRTNNQRALISLCALSVFVAVLGLITFPEYAIFWVGLFGLTNCSTFIIGMSFVGLRTDNPGQAAALSGLSQSIGYALAATGPTLVGYLHTATDSWDIPLLSIAAIALLCAFFANLAARDKKVLSYC